PLNMFWAGAIILYLYQPIVYFDYFVAWYGQDVLEETLLWVLLGLSFVVIGYEGRWGVRWGEMVPALPQYLSRQGLFGAALSLIRSEEHTSELQSQSNLVCRLLL